MYFAITPLSNGLDETSSQCTATGAKGELPLFYRQDSLTLAGVEDKYWVFQAVGSDDAYVDVACDLTKINARFS